MDVYYMNEAAFALPDDADAAPLDSTVTELRFAAGGGESFSLTVHRRPLVAGESLPAAVAANERDAARTLPSHAVLFQREIEIAGAPAIEIGASWRGKQSMLYTRQAHLALGGALLVLAGNAPLDARSECDAMMDRVIATFRPRASGAG
jgi:hypothetical protein